MIIQRLGDCIGKGAFGSVYKAFNWGTGEAVAVKQIKTADLPKSELRMIEVSISHHGKCVSGGKVILENHEQGWLTIDAVTG